jgi:NADH-quinone oxidoreductase subunit C
MTNELLPAEVADVLGAEVRISESFGVVTADLDGSRWVEAATAVRDAPATAMRFFDWLSAYDDGAAGLAVVARVYSLDHHRGVVLRTSVPKDRPEIASLTQVWAGANWHERETFEMFGVVFTGHPNLVPLLLPDGFEGNPLRKEFGLVSRSAKAWPGAKNPAANQARR